MLYFDSQDPIASFLASSLRVDGMMAQGVYVQLLADIIRGTTGGLTLTPLLHIAEMGFQLHLGSSQ